MEKDTLETIEESIKNTMDDTSKYIRKQKSEPFKKHVLILIGIIIVLIIFNQFLISGISGSLGGGKYKKVDVSEIYKIKSTGQAIASLFPVEQISSDQDAINMMIPQGTPDYGDSMGISFDDPVGSMNLLANNYNAIKADIKQNNPKVWERYLNLATKLLC